MDDPTFALFLAGTAAALLALAAWLADRRRARRRDPDAVGFMPWTTLFVWSFLAAVLLLAMATRLRFGA